MTKCSAGLSYLELELLVMSQLIISSGTDIQANPFLWLPASKLNFQMDLFRNKPPLKNSDSESLEACSL